MIWIIVLVWLLIGLLTFGFNAEEIDSQAPTNTSRQERGEVMVIFVILSLILGPLMTAIFIGGWLRKKIRKDK